MMEQWNVYAAPDVPDSLFPGGVLPGPGPDPALPVDYADYDFTNVNSYSDIDYTELRATLGVNYSITKYVRLFGGISYYDLDDNAPLYENNLGLTTWNNSGDVTRVSGGAVWTF